MDGDLCKCTKICLKYKIINVYTIASRKYMIVAEIS